MIKSAILFLSLLVSLVAASPNLSATKAFFNPNPPPTVYKYNTGPNTNFNSPYNSLTIPPSYNSPIYSPPMYNQRLYSPYGHSPSNFYWTNQHYSSHPFYYMDQNGNLIWVQPNK